MSNGVFNDHNMINGKQQQQQQRQSKQQQQQKHEMIQWIKDPVNQAVSFDDGIYLQSVLESIRKSSDLREWIRIHLFD